jgi:hypothetical protein
MPPVRFLLESRKLTAARKRQRGAHLTALYNLGFPIRSGGRYATHMTVYLPDDLTALALVLDLLCKVGTGNLASLFQALVLCREYSELMRFKIVPDDKYRAVQSTGTVFLEYNATACVSPTHSL